MIQEVMRTHPKFLCHSVFFEKSILYDTLAIHLDLMMNCTQHDKLSTLQVNEILQSGPSGF